MIEKSILIIGNNKWPALETIYEKYLSENYIKVKIFNVSDYTNFNILYKIRRKLNDLSVFNTLNKEIIKFAKKVKPDIIWIFKGVEIHIDTLITIKKFGIKLVNYNTDHPFNRVFSSNGGKNIELAIPFYDLHFTYSKEMVEKISDVYKVRTVLLPFGYELKEKELEVACEENEVIKACFIGNPDKWRRKQILYLANKGMQIDVYGHSWQKWLKSSKNITIFGAVYNLELWKVIRKYRVQINLFRPYNEGSHNMRTFEIPAVGGIQLAPDNQENRGYFTENQEIFLYNNLDDLIQKYEYLLKLDVFTVNQFRKNASQRSIYSNYSYKSRAEIVKNTFQCLLRN